MRTHFLICRRLSLWALALLAAAPLAAQPALTGPELYADVPSRVSAGLYQGPSATAVDATGHLLVVWVEGLEKPRLRGRVFDASGRPVRPAFTLAPGVAFVSPVLAPAAQEGFLLAWRTWEWNGHSALTRLFVRRLSASGRPRSAGIEIRQVTAASQDVQFASTQVAAASDGSFVVVWSETDRHTQLDNLFFRRFDAAGRPLANAAPLPLDGGHERGDSLSLDVRADGEIRVAWAVSLRRFDSNGVPLAPAVKLLPSDEGSSVTFGPDGGWLAFGISSLRAFAPDGTPFPEHPADLPYPYLVAAERGGTFLISSYPGESRTCILTGFQVNADGTPRGPVGCLTNPSDIADFTAFPYFSVTGTVEGGFVLFWSQAERNGEPAYASWRLYGQHLASAGPGTLQIERARSAVAESTAEPMTLQILRRDGTAGTVSVDYELSGAAAGNGTVTFPDGDSTPRAISIPVADDDIPGNDRVVHVALSHPTGGAVLGLPREAVVEVRDDDEPSPLLARAGPLLYIAGNTDDQLSAPGLAVLPRGGIEVAWGDDFRERYTTPEVHIFSVRSQRFDAAANPTAAFVQPLGVVPGWTRLAMHPAGDFMVFWQTGADWRVPAEGTAGFSQRFNARGEAAGPIIPLRFPVAGAAPLPDMRFVAVGRDGDAAQEGLFLHVLSGQGRDHRPPVTVSRDPLQPGAPAAVATDHAGRAVVVWAVAPTGAAPAGIFARRFDASGSPLGPPFRVNQEAGNDLAPSVAADAQGNFAVAWQRSWDGSGTGIYARSFNAAGAPLSDEIPVNSTTEGDQTAPSVALTGDGRFAVLWLSPSAVNGQLFTSSGKRLGSEARITRPFGAPTVVWSDRGFFMALFFNPSFLSARRLPLNP